MPCKKTEEVKLSDLEVGMKVRFHSSREEVYGWSSWANNDPMPQYLGGVHTVRKVGASSFHIEEDIKDRPELDGWFWDPSVIEEIVYEDDFAEGDFNLEFLLR